MTDQPRDLSQRAHRRLIGVLGLLLPCVLIVVAALRPTAGIDRWSLLPSVSAYYYTGAVAIFTGVLFALALFLATYPGYEQSSADRIVGRIGGAAALGVALFPTNAPGTVPAPSWWVAGLPALHFISAVLLFLSFIAFSLWLFRRSSVPRKEDRPFDKRFRDGVYLVCGLIMSVAVSWAAIEAYTAKGDTPAEIFLPESIAIAAFAVSWLVKGEVIDEPLKRMGARSGDKPPEQEDPTEAQERGAA